MRTRTSNEARQLTYDVRDGVVSIEPANETDLPRVSRIAAQNFYSTRTYHGLQADVVGGFAERNSVSNLSKKLHSDRHLFLVARHEATREAMAFAILKKLSETCMLATRMHVARECGPLHLGSKMLEFILAKLRGEGRELLYADVSGEAQAAIARGGGFLFVDSFVNEAISGARIDRLVIDVHAHCGTALAESAFQPLVSQSSPYACFLARYGLVVERLFRKVERMHETGSSGISQSVFAHVHHGLELLSDLRQRLGPHIVGAIDWADAETMWIFHDIGEIGMDADIPSYKKSRLDSENERAKASRILSSITPCELRAKLMELHDRYEQRKTAALSTVRGGMDVEATMCAFVDKLEASLFIASSGIGEVWKRRAGGWVFERILRKHALGAFLEPARELCRCLDGEGRARVRELLVSVVAAYQQRGLISSAFRAERERAIEAAVNAKRPL